MPQNDRCTDEHRDESLAEVRCAGWWSVDRGRPNERRATAHHSSTESSATEKGQEP